MSSENIHTSQTSKGAEKKELPCPFELLVNYGCLQDPLQFLRSEIPACAVWQFRLVIYKGVNADVFLLLTDADEFPKEDDRYLNSGKR